MAAAFYKAYWYAAKEARKPMSGWNNSGNFLIDDIKAADWLVVETLNNIDDLGKLRAALPSLVDTEINAVFPATTNPQMNARMKRLAKIIAGQATS